MAKCEEGYRCDVCGEDVEDITESQLYLRYVIGMLDEETLHVTPDRHLRCDPLLAQFIIDDDYPAIVVDGDFDKRKLDAEFVRAREDLVSRGWRRLRSILQTPELSVLDYPLPEVRDRMHRNSEPSSDSSATNGN